MQTYFFPASGNAPAMEIDADTEQEAQALHQQAAQRAQAIADMKS